MEIDPTECKHSKKNKKRIHSIAFFWFQGNRAGIASVARLRFQWHHLFLLIWRIAEV